MATSTQRPKAYWSPQHHKVFVDLCIEQVHLGNRPTHYFNRAGWNAIIKGFYKKTGVNYDKKQMKNHYDATKEAWKAWKKLVGKSGMGYNPVLRTITATEDAWATYVKANPRAAQFRTKSLDFKDKLDIIFGGTATKKDHAQAPDAIPDDVVALTIDGGDIPDMQTGPSESVPPMPNESSTSLNVETDVVEDRGAISSRKRKESLSPFTSHKQKEAKGFGMRLNSNLERLIETMALNQMGINVIAEERAVKAVKRLSTIEGLEVGGPLYLFALELLTEEKNRHIYMAIEQDDVCLKWLQYMYNRAHPPT